MVVSSWLTLLGGGGGDEASSAEPVQFKFSSFFTKMPCSSSELASEVLELSGCTRSGSVSWCPSGERMGGTLEDTGGERGIRQSMLDCLLREVVKDAGVLGPLRKDSGDLAASAETKQCLVYNTSANTKLKNYF